MAVPTPTPRNPNQIQSESANPSVTTINIVTTIEKTVTVGLPTAVAQVPSARAYAKVNPVTWVPLVILAILFLFGAMVVGWVILRRKMGNGFRVLLPARKLRKLPRQKRKIVGSPVCATGETLDFENFAINNRPPPTVPAKKKNPRYKDVEMTRLILEGKVPRPPPSPFKPLPPGIA
ncbi:hypothetical protein PGT21_016303 [Puccinia graminis f. sp. tritici]|uniref:Uncharacterized protein n=2 Tax=Puccinia graminis f. sp. tritici TaxID=56615 RepID=E3KAW9_PUCGT|nr:uncharacterized protein PGTG_06980 [Puccinia graminis f. sp. tritici CRL 75-36-700-3]KAA1083727.1 hypothetical protein PGT21_005311 [Puccinia graminis f. sp. tritici]EFP81359.2 hypothetical protein PGTG_06980 [Puccinia graminis f. sp. tritici CRL 75-36-700-3]KAA1119147.1 hypothetical protein PGT21_016303 [Puccinia graminis f. sp. tritici]KAA1122928.1 hypothetical protein PGTUg99_015246 [Puccinia graminis f. sp. tritici]KAA1133113.1 hypothetical protein PGTUg99_016163 [Puccinia graminis f. s